MNSTILDVCRKSGLSSATVSRVLNNSPLVAPDTRARVQRIMAEMNYRPSQAARTLVRGRTDTLGVVFPHIASGFYTELLRGIDAVAAENQLHLMTAFAHGLRDEETLIERMLMEGRVDAMILLNLDLRETFLRRLRRYKLPIILVDRPSAAGGLVAISIDNRSGAALAMTHLLQHGYRDLVVLTGPEDNYDSRERIAGCRAAAAQHGLTLKPDQIASGAFTVAGGRQFMEQWLATHGRPPRAILALNDPMALGVISVARERGLRIPADVALVGFDDCESANFVGLTSVHVPIEEMGRVASRSVLALLRGEQPVRAHIMATHLVVRDSCGCAPPPRQE